jgi:hypothetical protein
MHDCRSWQDKKKMDKKAKKPRKDPLVPVVFRVPTTMYDTIQEAVSLLKIDTSGLIRMMIAEHIGEYIARGRKGAESLAQARNTPPRKPVPRQSTERGTKRFQRNLDL